MDSELVSVVIPAFNAEAFLTDSISSVINQTHRPLELLVVNDGSTDGTVELVSRFQRDSGGVKVEIIDIGANRGAANALHEGFGKARGRYICWLSADDVFSETDKVSRQYARMRAAKADWSYYRNFVQGPSLSDSLLSCPSYLPRLRPLDFLFSDPKLRLACLMFRNPINGSSIMIKRDCIEAHGQFDPSLRNVDADGDLWMRYSALGLKCLALDGSPVFYRIHGSQTSKSKEKMSIGQQLSRIRIMRIMAKSGMLKGVFERFTALLPLALRRKDHLFLPKSTQYLCNYLLDSSVRANPFLQRQARKLLKDVELQMRQMPYDSSYFENELVKISDTPQIRSFELQLLGE